MDLDECRDLRRDNLEGGCIAASLTRLGLAMVFCPSSRVPFPCPLAPRVPPCHYPRPFSCFLSLIHPPTSYPSSYTPCPHRQ
eukprot:8401115-Pyramimonas_sp.AAC.1